MHIAKTKHQSQILKPTLEYFNVRIFKKSSNDRIKRSAAYPNRTWHQMAEDGRFELPLLFWSKLAFQASAFSHSANPPFCGSFLDISFAIHCKGYSRDQLSQVAVKLLHKSALKLPLARGRPITQEQSQFWGILCQSS